MSQKPPDTIPPELIGEDEALNSAVNYLNRGLKQNEDLLYVAPDWAQRSGAQDEPPWQPPEEEAPPAAAAPRRLEPEDRPAALKYGMVTIPPKYQVEVAERLAARGATEPNNNTVRMHFDQPPPAADVGSEAPVARVSSRKWTIVAVLAVLVAAGVALSLAGSSVPGATEAAPSAAMSSLPLPPGTKNVPGLAAGFAANPAASSAPDPKSSAAAELASAPAPAAAELAPNPSPRPQVTSSKSSKPNSAAPKPPIRKPATSVAPGGFDPAW